MPFNEIRANEPIEFIEQLKNTGDFYGKPFKLLDWQREVIREVYGTVKENGLRQYRFVYLEIPKKNGKTELIGGLGCYHAECDNPGGEIYCCAADKEQASKMYSAAKSMVEQEPFLNAGDDGNLKIIDSKKQIVNQDTGTFLKVVSAEAYTKHGMNPSVILFDELHAQPNRELWDIMTFGTDAARDEQLVFIITTAGDDPNRHSIGWEIHEQAMRISKGELIDPTWYVKIYGAPDDADIYDESVWYDCNPSLGVTINIDKVRQEAVTAKKSEANEKLFRWLRLNQWVQLKRVGWLPITLWDDTEKGWTLESLLRLKCYCGIDLSSKIDLTAIVLLFPPQPGSESWRFLQYTFCPEENIVERSRRDHVDYDKWKNEGYLTATPGNVIDYRVLMKHIENIDKLFDIKYFCGDPWHLEVLKQMLDPEIERRFIEIPQTMSGMSAGMGELERLFRSKEIEHQHNPLGRWAFGNVIVATDGNENIKPMKNKAIERIDPTVALIDAMAGAIKLEPKQSVYEIRGMRDAV